MSLKKWSKIWGQLKRKSPRSFEARDDEEVVAEEQESAAYQILKRLHKLCDENGDDPRIPEYAWLLFGQAQLAEGGQLKDPAAFGRRLADLLVKSLPS